MIPGELRTLIVEDNPNTLNYLKSLVDLNPDLVCIATANSVTTAIKEISAARPELILMDIELGDGEAFDILEKFPDDFFNVIFITGHRDYLEKAFDYYAFYYLTKPLDEEKFNHVIRVLRTKREKLFNHYNFNFLKNHVLNANSKFLLHIGNNYLVIDLDNVIACKSDGNYTLFRFLDGSNKLANNSIKFYSEQFRNRGFFRVSRFYLANSKNVKTIVKKEALIMKDGSKIPISSRNKEVVKEFIKRYNG